MLGPGIWVELYRRSMVMSETLLPSSFLNNSLSVWVQQFALNFVDVRRPCLGNLLALILFKGIHSVFGPGIWSEIYRRSMAMFENPSLPNSVPSSLEDEITQFLGPAICFQTCRRSYLKPSALISCLLSWVQQFVLRSVDVRRRWLKTFAALTLSLLLEKITHVMVQQNGFSFIDVRRPFLKALVTDFLSLLKSYPHSVQTLIR